MWHVSIASHHRQVTGDQQRAAALAALDGVGSPALGEWWQISPARRVLHLRRRLTPDEARVSGPMLDIRGTAEERRRLEAVRHELAQRVRSRR